MKKIFTLMLICLLVLLPVLTLSSCIDPQNKPDDPAEPSEPSEPTDPEDPIESTDPIDPTEPTDTLNLVFNGTSEYCIIIKDGGEGRSEAFLIRDAIQALTGVKLSIEADWDNKDNADGRKEILIGNVNRPEAKEIDEQMTGNRYAIVADGNKIIIAGASASLLKYATNLFIQEHLGYDEKGEQSIVKTLSLPSDLNILQIKDNSSTIALYVADQSATYVDALYQSLKKVSKSVTLMTRDDAPNTIFDFSTYGLVVVVGANALPTSAGPSMSYYMGKGGRMLFLGGPTFEDENANYDEIKIDHITPMYEQYPITNAASVFAAENQVIVGERNYIIPDNLISCHPGRQGTGFNKGTDSRFIPLIRVTDAKGLHSGYAAWLSINSSVTPGGKIEGSMVACFGAASNDFYNADGIAAVTETATAMMRHVFLIDGGTTEHIYIKEDTQEISVGANFVKLGGTDPEGLAIQVTLYDGTKELLTFDTTNTEATEQRNYIEVIQKTYDVSGGYPTSAVVTMTLDGQVIDKLEQEIRWWEPKENPSYVTMENGSFIKDGEPITFFGVNYMPSSGMADAEQKYWEHYVSDAAYDPDVIRYDLEHIKDIGMNAISVFVYYDYMKDCNNILDLITMAEELGLYVNLAIRSHVYPLTNYNREGEYFHADEAEVLVRRLHFYENDNIVGFDIAWERRIGNYNGDPRQSDNMPEYLKGTYIGRAAWDDDWTEWVKTQYGSIAHAEELWGCKAERNSQGELTLSDATLDSTGTKYTKMVNAYYRFIDDQVAKEMVGPILQLQSWAPNHFFTFRMSMSGSGCRKSGFYPSIHCFDFQSLASTLAYMEPEGYELYMNGSGTAIVAEYALQIPIANAYARYVNPEAPVVWKEIGMDLYTGKPNGNFNPDNSKHKKTEIFYRDALEYMYASYTSGVYAWLYAGGFRVGENTDCGILNPDGSDRLVTAVLREYAPKFINQGARPSADILIEVERENQMGGIFGIYAATQSQVRTAYDKGQFIDYVDANQDKFDQVVYADTVYNILLDGSTASGDGISPLRYVNGMVKDVTIVQRGDKTIAQIMICNTKQTIWKAGTVSLVSTADSDIQFSYTFDKDVDYLENVIIEQEISGTGNLALRFEVNDVLFGNQYVEEVK